MRVYVVSVGALARAPSWIGQLDPGTWSTQNTRQPYLGMSVPETLMGFGTTAALEIQPTDQVTHQGKSKQN